MSLILEALKKLEREKGTAERGFTVLAATPWPSRKGIRLTGILAGGLLVAAGLVVGLALRPRPPAPVAAPPQTSVAPATLAPLDLPLPIPPARPLPAVSAAAATPPPASLAAPSSDPRPSADTLRLQAISQRDGQPVAVLNERVVEEGDEFDGIRVIRIGPAEVEVDVGGRRRILTF